MSGEKIGHFRHCFVPYCNNTSVIVPRKTFFPVPKVKSVRTKWLELAKKDVKKNPMCITSTIYFCEDHFNIENDMEHIEFQKFLDGKASFRLKDGVYPSKFGCQNNSAGRRVRKSTSNSTRRRRKIGKLGAYIRWHSNNVEKPSTSSVSMESEDVDVERDHEPISDSFSVIEDDESSTVNDTGSDAPEIIVVDDSNEEGENLGDSREAIIPELNFKPRISKFRGRKKIRKTDCIQRKVIPKIKTQLRKIPNILKSSQRLTKSSQNNTQSKNNVKIPINPGTSTDVDNIQITFDSNQMLPNMPYTFESPNVLKIAKPRRPSKSFLDAYVKCAVDTCDNYIDDARAQYFGQSYFVFPEDPVKKQSWLTAINKPSNWNTSQSIICYRHFHKKDLLHGRLSPHAIPTKYNLCCNIPNKNAPFKKLRSSAPKDGLSNHLITTEEPERFVELNPRIEEIDPLNDIPIITIKEEPVYINDSTISFLDASHLKILKNEQKKSETIRYKDERTSHQKCSVPINDSHMIGNKKVEINKHTIIKEESDDFFEIIDDDDVIELIPDEIRIKEEPLNIMDVSTDGVFSEPSTSKATVAEDIKSPKSEIINEFMTYVNSEVKKNLEKLPSDRRVPLIISIVEKMNEFMKKEF